MFDLAFCSEVKRVLFWECVKFWAEILSKLSSYSIIFECSDFLASSSLKAYESSLELVNLLEFLKSVLIKLFCVVFTFDIF